MHGLLNLTAQPNGCPASLPAPYNPRRWHRPVPCPLRTLVLCLPFLPPCLLYKYDHLLHTSTWFTHSRTQGVQVPERGCASCAASGAGGAPLPLQPPYLTPCISPPILPCLARTDLVTIFRLACPSGFITCDQTLQYGLRMGNLHTGTNPTPATAPHNARMPPASGLCSQ